MKRVNIGMVMALLIGSTALGRPEWKADVSDVAIPDVPAQGQVHGVDFEVEEATISGGVLTLRQGEDFFADQELMIFLFLEEDESPAGKEYLAQPGEQQFGNPHIHMRYRVEGESMPETEMFMNRYSIQLRFGEIADGTLSGEIYLTLPDEHESFVAGRFEAKLEE